MAYIIFKDGYPVNAYQDIPHQVLGIELDASITDQDLADKNCYTFIDNACPNFDCNLYYQKETWEIQGFNCIRTWTLLPQDEGEAWNYIRDIRNKMLADSDWTQLPDNALSENEKNDWASYRNSLRNITDNFNSPQAVVWPIKP